MKDEGALTTSVSKVITITNRLGLHARPAAMVVKAASQFEAEVFLIKEHTRINAKSIMGVMMLAAEFGSALEILAEGPDAREATDAVAAVFASNFGEE
jgi:phosphocarrier protein HPr